MLPPVNAMIKPNAQSILNCHLPNSSQLFEVIPIKLHGPRGSIEIFAMFDDGSSISILDESIAKQLGLQGNLQPLQLQWYGEQIHTEMSTRVSLEISGQDLNKFKLKNVCTIKNLNLPVQSFSKGRFPHLEFIPLIDYNNVKPS